ncbi:MAG: sodium transporter [Kiritimatiellae bacterium]|nr:sodium transporter [Kiritimatiellia bacterium]
MSNGLGTLDYTAIAIYLTLMAGIGVVMGLIVKNVKEFFAGGNNVPWHLGAVSNYMTMMSAFVFVAHAGIAYQDGLVALLILWSAVPAALAGTAFLASRWRRAGLVTPVEYLEQRYNAPVRQITSWGGVIFRVMDNMVRLYALGVFVSGSLGCPMTVAIVLCGGIVVAYTMVGGLWAVIVTDAIQCAILLMVTTVMVPLALTAAGGLWALTEALPHHFTWTHGPKGSFWFLFVYYVMVLIKFNGNWAFIQRFYCTEDELAAKKMGLFSAVLFFVCPVIFLLPAIAAAALVPGLANPEEAYVSVCKLLLPPGVMGLMIAAMLAATMSSLSSEYNVTAGVLTRDIYQRLLRPHAGEREQMVVARVTTLLLGGAIMWGASLVKGLGGAFEVNKTLMGLFGVPLVVPLIFGVLWRKPKPWGAVFSIISGVFVGLALRRIAGLDWETATFVQMFWCVASLLVSAAGESHDTGYARRVGDLFLRLETPVSESEGAHDRHGHQALLVLFTVALGLSGLLFIGISLFSVSLPSGRYTLAAGVFCCVCAVLAGLRLRMRYLSAEIGKRNLQ